VTALADIPVAAPVSSRRSLVRRARKRLTLGALRAALSLAPRLNDRAADTIERALAGLHRLGPLAPHLGRVVRANMRRAGVFRDQADRQYFHQVALHLTGAIQVLRHGRPHGEGVAGRLAELIRRRVLRDESIENLRRAVAMERGVIIAPVHACQFLLGLARINQEVPVTVYLRYSRNAAGREAKRIWCRACGMRMIAEPSKAADPAARAAALAEVLAQKQVLVITPDVAQRRGKGVPVQLLGREVHLASGAASLSVLTGAPVVPVTVRPAGDKAQSRVIMSIHKPIEPPDVVRKRGWRQEAIRQVQQRWTLVFEKFLRDYPHLWWLWADNRWTRAWRGDPKYSGPGTDR